MSGRPLPGAAVTLSLWFSRRRRWRRPRHPASLERGRAEVHGASEEAVVAEVAGVEWCDAE